jgi:hypothetical protein
MIPAPQNKTFPVNVVLDYSCYLCPNATKKDDATRPYASKMVEESISLNGGFFYSVYRH